MDQETRQSIAQLRYEMAELKTALGVRDYREAELTVGKMRTVFWALVAWAKTQGFKEPK